MPEYRLLYNDGEQRILNEPERWPDYVRIPESVKHPPVERFGVHIFERVSEFEFKEKPSAS